MAAHNKSARLSASVITGIAGAKRLGLQYNHAARIAGVEPLTLADWLRRGRDDAANGKHNTLHAQLLAACDKAHADLVEERLQNITKATKPGLLEKVVTTVTTEVDGKPVVTKTERVKAGPGDWAADAWLLEKLHPDQFGSRAKVEVSLGEGTEKVETIEDLVRLAAKASKK